MNNQETFLPQKVPRYLLLSTYSIIIVFFFLIYFDSNFLNSMINFFFFRNSESLFFFIYVFLQTPHILLSYFGFASLSYLNHYRYLFFPLLLVLLGGVFTYFFFPTLFGVSTFLIYLSTLSNYHFAMQHVGITKALMRNGSCVHFILGIICFIYLQLTFFDYFFDISFLPEVLRASLALGMLVLITGVTYYLSFLSKTKVGLYYLYSNLIMYISFILFAAWNYFFFLVLTMRVIHDITAMIFYVSHANSQYKNKQDNFFLPFFRKLPLPFFISLPLFTFILAVMLFFLSKYSGILATTLIFMALAHYIFECVIWKRDSLHRKEISI